MKRRLPIAIGAAVIAMILAVGWIGGRSSSRAVGSASPAAPVQAPPAARTDLMSLPANPRRPTTPPRPEDVPPEAAEPRPPILTPELRAELAEKVRGAPHPGMAAFRAFSDLYVERNAELAQMQAAQEGLTLAEVRELTHLGLLVLATQRVPEVEEMLGHELGPAEREALGTLMRTSNEGFKTRMRELVARGGSQAERVALIDDTRARYLTGFYQTTGMNEALLDDLLAGNLALPGAPIATRPPEGAAPVPASPEAVAPATRPAAEPAR